MSEVYIIAEIGINANGSRTLALDMMKMAKEAGCDAVKFQKRDLYTVYTPEFLASPRQSPWGTTQYDQKAGLEFDVQDYDVFFDYAYQVGLEVFASAWDLKSLEFIEGFNPAYHKIASAMLTHDEFVETVAHIGKTTFISTGMSTEWEIDKVVDFFKKAGTPFTLMHCVSTYPCPECDTNLNVIPYLKHRYNCDVGFSDHSGTVWISPIAVSLGASVIECHVTLDRRMYGSDQAASIEKGGLERLVQWSRKVHAVLGDGEKRVTPQEMDVARKLRYWREATE